MAMVLGNLRLRSHERLSDDPPGPLLLSNRLGCRTSFPG